MAEQITPPSGEAQQPPTSERSNSWIWILLVVILIVIGIGVYFFMSGGSDGGASGIAASGGSNSIPQPPAFPS